MIMNSQITKSVKTELNSVKVYAEGRGIRIDVRNDSILADIELMINIKLNN